MQMCTRTEERMKMTFAYFAKGFWDKPVRVSYPRPTTLKSTIRGQIADITQELQNLPELTATDRRALSISRAVAFLLEGR
jgi:hypothetical protein